MPRDPQHTVFVTQATTMTMTTRKHPKQEDKHTWGTQTIMANIHVDVSRPTSTTETGPTRYQHEGAGHPAPSAPMSLGWVSLPL